MTAEALLRVRGLAVRFGTKRGLARVVNGIDYDVAAGETVAIVGESGSGKSVSVLSLMGLVRQPPGRVEGEAWFEGTNLIGASTETLRRIRGNRLAMIFQDPMTSLNPVLTIGRQLGESVRLHHGLSRRQADERCAELLDLVGIPRPRRHLKDYPHRFSGGMRQRVMIAMGLSTNPSLLIADEPTTALDVTTQAQIIDLVGDLQQRFGMAIVWITHDLGVVAGLADRVLVMYGGRIAESGSVRQVMDDPRHPYTRGLLASLPTPGAERPPRLFSIPGLPPDPVDLPDGCPFWARCTYRLDPRERDSVPSLRDVGDGHLVACNYDVPDELVEAVHQ